MIEDNMTYGNVTSEQYWSGIHAIKWTLMKKRKKVNILKNDLEYAEKEVKEIEKLLEEILRDAY